MQITWWICFQETFLTIPSLDVGDTQRTCITKVVSMEQEAVVTGWNINPATVTEIERTPDDFDGSQTISKTVSMCDNKHWE